MNYKLLADSGSTKTDWVLLGDEHRLQRMTTQGINPFMLDCEAITAILRRELLPSLENIRINSVDFYGAGCRGEQCKVVEKALWKVFQVEKIMVDSDMLGAARALCGDQEGIACILGTGSNSCLYDGNKIVTNVAPLGFILGDEGSGAVLGKRLLGDILKQQLPASVCRAFHEKYQFTADEIIRKVYKEPFPNRFLASFAPFLNDHKEEKEIEHLLLEEFVRFFKRNVANYHRKDLSVHFVGSIAYYFQSELKRAAEISGFRLGSIKKAPLEDE